MKTILCSLLFLTFCVIAKAQDFSKVSLNTVWYQSDSKIEQIYPVTTNGSQMNGLFKKKVKLVFNGGTSDVKVKEIILYAYANPTYMQSPNNFGIIPLTSESGNRTYLWITVSAAKSKTNEGFIPIKYEKVAENVFKVYPEQQLEPGEYGFVNSIGGMPSIIYGFTIVK